MKRRDFLKTTIAAVAATQVPAVQAEQMPPAPKPGDIILQDEFVAKMYVPVDYSPSNPSTTRSPSS